MILGDIPKGVKLEWNDDLHKKQAFIIFNGITVVNLDLESTPETVQKTSEGLPSVEYMVAHWVNLIG